MEERREMVRALVIKKIKSLARKEPQRLPLPVLVDTFHWCHLDYDGPVRERPTNEEIVEALDELLVEKRICFHGFLESNGHILTLVDILRP